MADHDLMKEKALLHNPVRVVFGDQSVDQLECDRTCW
jgi:hypothetical protein